jgi:hypothetical protein
VQQASIVPVASPAPSLLRPPPAVSHGAQPGEPYGGTTDVVLLGRLHNGLGFYRYKGDNQTFV